MSTTRMQTIEIMYGPLVQICFLNGLEMLNAKQVTRYWKFAT